MVLDLVQRRSCWSARVCVLADLSKHIQPWNTLPLVHGCLECNNPAILGCHVEKLGYRDYPLWAKRTEVFRKGIWVGSNDHDRQLLDRRRHCTITARRTEFYQLMLNQTRAQVHEPLILASRNRVPSFVVPPTPNPDPNRLESCQVPRWTGQ